MSFAHKEALNVHKALKNYGIETPFFKSSISLKKRTKKIERYMNKIIYSLNLDIKDNSLLKTSRRVSRMYTEEIFFGLDYNNFPKISLIKNNIDFNEMLIVRDINFTTICEHHFVVIDGKATIAYIPKKNIIGLSKINKIVYFFSKRPQIQERLTKQILVSLQTLLHTESVAVSITAIHYCMRIRGVYDTNSDVKTGSFGGFFETNKEKRKEFLKNTFINNR